MEATNNSKEIVDSALQVLVQSPLQLHSELYLQCLASGEKEFAFCSKKSVYFGHSEKRNAGSHFHKFFASSAS